MNNWYNRINGANPVQQSQHMSFQNPVQKAQYISNIMRNPVQFVKEQFPDIPENIINNPNAVLNYLQQTRGNKFIQDMNSVIGNGRR